ncbi:MAG TPA: hypothetical protein VGF67_15520 [Ktedonobacteraceae bacterium]|jgi:hypothetical protein
MRAGLSAETDDREQFSVDSRRMAMQLARQFGGLPLALVQAEAYIEEMGCNLQEYEQLYETHWLSLFRERRSRLADHPEAVLTTRVFSFQ